ncbi:MAG: four helix bundle protein, partial [Actinomycetota bacterium]
AQVRRSAAGIPTNIAEGSGRPSEVDYARFIGYAGGSCNETEYHLLLARELGFLEAEDWSALDAEVGEIRSMLVGFSKRLQ